MIIKHDEAKQFVLAEGVESRIKGYGGTVMMVENIFKKGIVAGVHTHMHEQAVYIVEGSFEFTVGEEAYVVHAGDSFYIPPEVPHGCVALEDDSKVLDIFSPLREDFLERAK